MVTYKSKNDGQNTYNAIKFQNKRNIKSLLVASAILVILGLLLIWLAIENKGKENLFIFYLVSGILWLALGIFYIPLVNWLSKKQQKAVNSSASLINESTEVTYKFDEDKLYIYTVMGTKFREATELDYGLFYEVCEDNDTFILFLSKIQCYVINKKDIVSGTIDETRAILKKYFAGEKYKSEVK